MDRSLNILQKLCDQDPGSTRSFDKKPTQDPGSVKIPEIKSNIWVGSSWIPDFFGSYIR